MSEQMDEELGGLPEGYKFGIKEAVQNTMQLFFSMSDVIGDLKVRLVRNLTKRAFITSDNPAVMANHWHQADLQARDAAPGLQNAGMIALLPLSPSVMCLLLDGSIYSLSHAGGWVDLKDEADANALNEHQVLSCEANLYFAGWEARDDLSAFVESVRAGRPASRHMIDRLVLDRAEADAKVYRAVSAAEARGEEGMVHTSMIMPRPSRWPGLIRWQSDGSAYDSHSGAGFSRPATRDPQVAYTKVRIRPGWRQAQGDGRSSAP